MDAFRQLGKTLVNAVTTRPDGKPPPDDLLVAYREQLSALRDDILLIRQQFSSYAESVLQATELSVVLGKSITNFYKESDHSGRMKSVQAYYLANEDIATKATNIFQEQLHSHDGLIAEIDNWLQAIRVIQGEIEDCERSRAAAITTSNRLQTLQEQYAHRKKQMEKSKDSGGSSWFGGGSSGSVRSNGSGMDKDLEELKNRIESTSEVKKSLGNDFKNLKDRITRSVTNMVKDKYRMFDSIYVQLLESQYDFFRSKHMYTQKFEKSISYYRKNYPKNARNHSENSHSNESSAGPPPPSPKHPRATSGEVGSFSDGDGPLYERRRSSSIRKRPPPQPAALAHGKSPRTRGVSSPHQQKQQLANHMMHQQQKKNSAPPNRSSAPMTNATFQEAKPAQKAPAHLDDFLFFSDSNPPPAHSAPPQTSPHHAPAGSGGDDFDFFNVGNNSAQAPVTVTNGPSKPKHTKDFSIGDFLSRTDTFGDVPNAGTSTNVSPIQEEPFLKQRQPSDDFTNWFGSQAQQAPRADLQNKTSSKSESAINRSMIPGFSTQPMTPPQPIAAQLKKNQVEKSPRHQRKVSHNTYVRNRIEFVNKEYAKEKQEHEDKEKAKDKFEKRIDEWEFNNNVRRNIRSLLTKLPEILWEGSGWKPVSLGDLVTPNKCRKHYQKALRIVHPDRAANRKDDIERKVVCERVFTALNEAWQEFESKQ